MNVHRQIVKESTIFDDGVAHLVKRDDVLAGIIRHVGPCTLKRSNNYFLTLLEAIIWQQLSWKAATAIHERLLASLGKRRPRPCDILATPRSSMTKAGLSRQKVRYVRELADFFESNRFPKRNIRHLPDEGVVDVLTEIKGIGRWSAEMFLIFGLNRLDVFPLGDLGLKKAVGHRFGFNDMPTPEEIGRVTDRWRPYRTIASWYLWASIDGLPFDDAAGVTPANHQGP